MASFAVLLRAVNVGPSLRVTSADLLGAAETAGLGSARTLLNSGNLVATPGTSGAAGPADAARLVQDRLSERLGQDVSAVGLSGAQLDRIALANPFPAAARDHPSQLQVHVPFGELDEAGIARLDLGHPGREMLATGAGVLYVHYVDGIARSKLTPKVVDKAAGAPTTARNWNTITKLRTACAALDSR
ncbi:DUF1697 domain-containing protein [Promicromonospora vindobonensis]|uniref:DUF1697 domain-containing protein n=1 Tax=Promicromonospora vindobonensis TaxID=195748 RepID=A0ABW5W154_9MICO